jgi:AraC-like DNA-binding protein
MKAELIVDAPIFDRKEIWVKKIYKPHFDHPFHFHEVCELVWVKKSFGKFIIGDHIGNFSEGELVLQGSELPHIWQCDKIFYTKNKKLFTKATTLYFSASFILNLTDNPSVNLANKELLKKAQRGIRLTGKARENIIQNIKAIEDSEGLQQLSYFLSIIYTLTHTTEYDYLASVGYKNSKTEFDLTRFTEVYQFLLSNFQRDIMLAEVAGICNMTPNAFCRYFKLKTQKTFSRFLNELRIGHACKLLQTEKSTIDKICYDCGYNNPTNFFKFFKLVTKKTPKEYQRYIMQMNNIK